MAKYKITNTSATSTKGARNVFLIEAGKLLKPGDHCLVSRLTGALDPLIESNAIKVDEGDFERPSLFADEPPALRARHKVVEVPPPGGDGPAPTQAPTPEPEVRREPEPVKASDILGDDAVPSWAKDDSSGNDDSGEPDGSSDSTETSPSKKTGRRR